MPADSTPDNHINEYEPVRSVTGFETPYDWRFDGEPRTDGSRSRGANGSYINTTDVLSAKELSGICQTDTCYNLNAAKTSIRDNCDERHCKVLHPEICVNKLETLKKNSLNSHLSNH